MKLNHEGFSRREFLKGTAAAAAGAAVMGTVGASAPVFAEEDASAEYLDTEKANAKWSFEIAPDPIPEEEIAETLEADIIVVGCGVSGLMTACSAAESNQNVIIVSASEAPVSRGGSNNAVYSKCMERLGLDKQPVEHFKKEIFYQTMDVDQQKWFKYYANSEEAMNWCIDLMEGRGYETFIEPATDMPEDSWFHIPDASHGWRDNDEYTQVGMTQPLFARTLAEHFTELGGSIYFRNRGVQLVREDEGTGRVDAVICEREDGTYAKYVGTKAIVLATGDFSANRDMMHKYCAPAADHISDEVYDGETNYDISFQYGGLYKGEGQQMGLWVGAAWQKNIPNCVMGFEPLPGAVISYGCHWGLMVDRNGRRFMDEYSLNPPAGMPAKHLENGEGYAIWDMNYAKKIGSSTSWMQAGGYGEIDEADAEEQLAATVADWDASVQNGMYVKADTLEELIEKLGLPASTMDTIEQYNEYARNGEDLEFYKDPSVLLEINEGPFYGAKCDKNTYVFLTVLGGLRTNINMQVCDENDDAIPGLYNVGTMVGDVFAHNYSFMVEGANYGMNCITFGYLTGKYIAENE